MRSSDGFEEMSTILPGDLLLVRGNTWVDGIIRKITRSKYSHVAGVFNQEDAVEILPFNKTGFKKLLLYTGRADIYTCKDLTNEQRRKILKYVLNKVGTKYAYNLILWEASRYLLHWKWRYKSHNNCLCSTLWAEAYRNAGIDLCPNILYPSPRDLEESTLLEKVRSY